MYSFDILFSWFFEDLTRSEAERLLQIDGLPTGTFLIRKRKTARISNLALSLRDETKILHFLIVKLDNGGYYLKSTVIFQNLHDLVAHYMMNADQLPCKLTLAPPGKTFIIHCLPH